MYLVKKNNNVVLNKGDYFTQTINMTFGSFPTEEKWYLDYGDHVLFHIMAPRQRFNDAIIKKDLTYLDCDSEGNVIVELQPEDTMSLDPGVYYYEVKLVYNEGSDDSVVKVDTIVQRTKFTLVE